MKIVMLLVARDDADVVDAQIAFHLSLGVEYVFATDHASTDGTADVLESYRRDGVLRRVTESGEPRDSSWRAAMAELAIDEGADWILDAEVDEFWMPRAENFREVLAAMPKRYGIVQGLVRVFPPRPTGEELFADRMVLRGLLSDLRSDESEGRLDWALRPLFRASDDMVILGDREAVLDGRVPLRAWYPVEVLRFPIRSPEQAERKARGRSGPVAPRSRTERLLHESGPSETATGVVWPQLVVSDAAAEQGLANGSLVLDERLRDALGRLPRSTSPTDAGAARFAVLSDGLALPSPSVVDDVAYAGECAAVHEVDFEPLQTRLAELERRIGLLETGRWLRLRRRLARVVRR